MLVLAAMPYTADLSVLARRKKLVESPEIGTESEQNESEMSAVRLQILQIDILTLW